MPLPINPVADTPGSSATTTTIAMDGTLHGTISGGSDHDWYRVNLVAGQTYTFAAVGIGTGLLNDPYLNLIGTNGTSILAFNDDGLPNRNSILTYTATATGTYFLDVSGYGTSTGTYGLSATLGTRADFDPLMIGGVIDTNYSWSATHGTGATVTFGFRSTDPGQEPNFSRFSAQEMAAAREILALYSEYINVTFTEVNPGGYTNNATMLMANYEANDGAGAFGYYPGSTAASAQAGDMWYNGTPVQSDILPGSWIWGAFMHEFGHNLGLSHPGDYNAGVGLSITYGNSAQFIQDSNQYTIMSYFDGSETGATGGGYDTPMLYDIMALQTIYGANMTTRTGNSTYGFNSNTGPIFDFTINTSPNLTIWDAGGIDTLDASRFAASQRIDLNAGTFSDIGGQIENVSIAYGATIEHAVGGRGADTITGNAVQNFLYGGDGADTLFGGNGNDRLYGGAGGDHLFGGAGADLLYGGAVGVQTQPEVFHLVTTDFSNGASVRLTGAQLFPNQSFTLELIWQQTALVDQHYSLDFGNFSIYRYNDGSAGLKFNGASVDDWRFDAIGSGLFDGEAHRLSITYDDASGHLVVYIDGNESFSTDFAPGTRGLSTTGTIVLDDDAGVGDIRIFDHALDAETIWDNAWSSISPTTSGLVQYWSGNGSGTLVSQIAGHPNLINQGATGLTDVTLSDVGGVDIMEGGLGNDRYTIFTANDVVIEAADEGRDIIVARVNYAIGEDVNVESIRGIGYKGLTLTGNSQDNTFFGSLGHDTFVGGDGNDRYIIESSVDDIVETATGGSDTILASANYVLGAGVAVEYIRASVAGLTLVGNELSNTIVGSTGSDTLNGGAGQDRLFGGVDDATDVFVFSSAEDCGVLTTRDIVADFTVGVDLIDLTAIDANINLAGQQALSFSAGGVAAAYSVWATEIGTTTLLRMDINGDGVRDYEICVTQVTGMTASDLLL